jgi:hypothetical protein
MREISDGVEASKGVGYWLGLDDDCVSRWMIVP